jgi:hypothetical protein
MKDDKLVKDNYSYIDYGELYRRLLQYFRLTAAKLKPNLLTGTTETRYSRFQSRQNTNPYLKVMLLCTNTLYSSLLMLVEYEYWF